MLMVISVAMLLMSLAAPSLVDLSPTRKSAIREVRMGLERARLMARKENRVTYVAFADGTPPSTDDRYRLYAIFRAEDELQFGSDSAGISLMNQPVAQVSRWESLPAGFLFATGSDFEAMPGETFQTILDSPHRRPFPFNLDQGTAELPLPFVAFHPSGRVEVPPAVESSLLHCGIASGYCEANGERILTGTRPGMNQAGEFAQGECLALNRYTGKARVITD